MPVLENPRHEAFAQGLAKGKTADDAYTLAGYRPHRGNASTLRANQNISDRVAELLSSSANRAEITVTRVLKELARIGTADFRKAFDQEGNLLPIKEWDDELAAAVSSIEVVTRGLPGETNDELDGQPHGGALARKRGAKVEYVHKVKFWDKNSALEKIAKHLGMFIERIGGPDGAPLDTTVTHKLDPASAKLIADLIK
jgi:phage terminase small subunit